MCIYYTRENKGKGRGKERNQAEARRKKNQERELKKRKMYQVKRILNTTDDKMSFNIYIFTNTFNLTILIFNNS